MAQTKLDSPLAQARLSKEQALAKLRVLQSAALEGKLLDRDQVRAQWAQAFAALRDSALRMAESTKVAESSKIGPTASASDYSNHARLVNQPAVQRVRNPERPGAKHSVFEPCRLNTLTMAGTQRRN